MVGLLDIVPRTSVVVIDGNEIEVRGLNVKSIAHLLSRFPQVRSMFSGQDIDFQELMNLLGDGVGLFIALGVVCDDEGAAEKAANNLPMADQIEIVLEIYNKTFPRGIGPFVERLQKMGINLQSVNSDPQGTDPASS